MSPEVNEILKKIATAKGLTAVLIIVFLGIFVWKNIDFLTEVSVSFKKSETKTETKTKVSGSDKKTSGVSELALGEVLIPPAPKKLSSFAVFEIKNPGSAITNQVRISIDFGAAKVSAYEIIGPNQGEANGSEPEQSVINVDIAQLRPQESVYIYAQTNSPAFKKITLSSKDIASVIEYTYGDYLKQKEPGTVPGFMGFLFFLLGGFLLVMTIYSTVVLIRFLNRWLNLKW